MFNTDLFTTLDLTNAANPNLFPFPFELHVGFSIVAFIFFMLRFFFDKRPYQLILALAVPFSMTLWLSESKIWFYALGAIELALLVIAIISDAIYKAKHPELKEEKKKSAKAEEKNEEMNEEKAE